MEYFKIDGVDFSKYVKNLNITKNAVYNAQTNAAGNTVVDYINSKREIEVGIIPLNDTSMAELLTAVQNFEVYISFRNPVTNEIDMAHCIIPDSNVEYYTIQVNKVMYNELTLTFVEL